MKVARCLILVAIASVGGALLPSEGQAVAPTRKVQASKAKRTGDYGIAQIRPTPSRKARGTLSGFESLDRRVRAHRVKHIVASVSRKSIAEALLEPPSLETIDVLFEYGVPVIEGVPPIFFLFPRTKTDSENILIPD